MDADLKTADQQNALTVHLKTAKLSSANVLKHFHKLPGSLPAQPPRPAGAVAACPGAALTGG